MKEITYIARIGNITSDTYVCFTRSLPLSSITDSVEDMYVLFKTRIMIADYMRMTRNMGLVVFSSVGLR